VSNDRLGWRVEEEFFEPKPARNPRNLCQEVGVHINEAMLQERKRSASHQFLRLVDKLSPRLGTVRVELSCPDKGNNIGFGHSLAA